MVKEAPYWYNTANCKILRRQSKNIFDFNKHKQELIKESWPIFSPS